MNGLGVLQALNFFVLYNYCSITHCFYNVGFREEKSMYGGVSLLLAGVHCSSGNLVWRLRALPPPCTICRRSIWQFLSWRRRVPLPVWLCRFIQRRLPWFPYNRGKLNSSQSSSISQSRPMMSPGPVPFKKTLWVTRSSANHSQGIPLPPCIPS